MTVAEHETINTNAYISGPIVQDSLYFYLGAGFSEYGGEYNNTIGGDEVGGEETTTFTGKLLWTPSDSFEASKESLGVQSNLPVKVVVSSPPTSSPPIVLLYSPPYSLKPAPR